MLAAAAKYFGRLLRASLYVSDLNRYAQETAKAQEEPEEDLLAGLPSPLIPDSVRSQDGWDRQTEGGR